jgi:glutathione peroxidase
LLVSSAVPYRALQASRITGAATLFWAMWMPANTLAAPAQPSAASCPPLLQHTFPRLQDGAPQNLCQFQGKVLLIVNTASYCGFTSQYQGLEALHARYAPRGLEVLGFPSNDFGQQEPGNSKQIADVCFNTYGVKFPMFEKSVVVGNAASPLYKALRGATGTSPKWNFHKYLVGRNGKVLASYPSNTEPLAPALLADVQRALKTP